MSDWNDQYEGSTSTSAHPFSRNADGCGDSLVGLNAYHNGMKICKVVDIQHDHDLAVIYDDGGTTPIEEVWNPGDHSDKYDTVSTMSRSAIDIWMQEGRPVTKYGVSTGYVGGCVSTGTVSARGKKERPGNNFGPCADYWYDTVRWGELRGHRTR